MKMRILSRQQVMEAVNLDKVLETVENVYKSKAMGNAVPWPTVFYDFKTGEKDMDIKSGYIKGDEIHGLKIINWTDANSALGLPTLIGLIMVFDTNTGMPVGVLDGSFITGIRTGCAGAIGAKYLARPESETLFVLGAGNQAFFQMGAFIKCFPGLKKIYIADPFRPENAEKLAETAAERLLHELKVDASDISFEAAYTEEAMKTALRTADMVATVTPARNPIIKKEWVQPGTHFSCIGSDMSGKEEIEGEIFRDALIYVDDYHHVVEVGEMEIPLRDGIITEADIKGEMGQLILGRIEGRSSQEQITIYDACGMALLDIATAKAALDLAESQDMGTVVEI